MWNDHFDTPTNPYHYVLHCIGGKWKMTILHEIHTYGSIRFNQTLKALPISEKVFSQQLRDPVFAKSMSAAALTVWYSLMKLRKLIPMFSIFSCKFWKTADLPTATEELSISRTR